MNNDDILVKLTLMIAAMGAFIFPFMFFISAFATSGKMLGRLGQAVQNGMQRAARTAGRAGRKAAMNSKYGQAAQQFMGNRKAIKSLKGREALTGALEKNPNLMKLMGGPGGGKYAARFLDSEQRKHESEQVSNLKQGLTPNVAGAIGSGHSISDALRSGRWKDGKRIEDSDRVALTKLQQEGYMDQNYNVKRDAHLARAALGSIMDAEIANPENVRGLAAMNGSDTRANALFTETLTAEASKHGYKNLQYASVTNGQMEQFYVKPKSSILASGLSGVNKDSLDPTQDMSLLNELGNQYNRAPDKNAYIRKIAEQTKHIDKDGIVKAIAAQLGGGSIAPDPATGEMRVDVDDSFLSEFQALRSSLKSGGAIPPPQRFTVSAAPAAAPTPAPAPAAPAPPPPGYQQAPGNSQLVVPHSPPANTPPRPRAGGNFNGFND